MERKTVEITPEQLHAQQEICEKISAYWKTQGRTPRAMVDTYGCQQNEADSERIRGMLQSCGYAIVDEEEGADCIVINTCAIREHAEDRVYGNVGALTHTKNRHPAQKIFLCGCMMGQPAVAERIKKSYRHVDGVFNPHQLWRFPELLDTVLTTGKRVFATEDSDGVIAEGLPVVRSNGLKAWVSIMYGCNNFCTYCVVPYVRGRERSRRPEDILAEARQLVESGCRDITLLGQNVNSYGKGLSEPCSFAELLRQVNAIEGDFRIRFMTSHPRDCTKELIDAMAECDKVCKHLHLPVQSGSDRILTVMNRHYDLRHYEELLQYAREKMPNLSVTSDIIVGFPGETREDFEKTLELVRRIRYSALFTFIYSRRSGTAAEKLPDPIPAEEKSRWFRELLDTQGAIGSELLKGYVGRTLRVLAEDEGKSPGTLSCRSEDNTIVEVAASPEMIGEFMEVQITDAMNWALRGERI